MIPVKKTLFVGIGNIYRSDDAIGIEIVRQLKALALPHSMITEHSGEGAGLLEIIQKTETVYLFDAVKSGKSPPGTIFRLDAQQEQIPPDFFNYSTHDFSVAEAIELARILNQIPPELILYGVEGKIFHPGRTLSPEVTGAIPEVIKYVRTDLERNIATRASRQRS